jgi:hypothetical protein
MDTRADMEEASIRLERALKRDAPPEEPPRPTGLPLSASDSASNPVVPEGGETGTNLRCSCGGALEQIRACAAYVCDRCSRHKGLVRCWCGWSESGGDGRAELEEMGEQIDPEE